MKGFGAVYRKELHSLFASPIFHVVAVMFLLIAGYFFYGIVVFYNLVSMQASQDPFLAKQLNLTEGVLRPFFLDIGIVLLLISPLLTMRSYAEERKAGTLELLFTYPISDGSTVLAKFTAAATALLVVLAGTLPGVFLLGSHASVAWSPVLCGYLGMLLLGGAFLSLGVFTSSLTQNQIVAAVLSFGLSLLLWVIGWIKNAFGPGGGEIVDYLSITSHFDTFAKGVLDSRDVLYYVMFIVFFLFLTLKQMGSYRWRG